MTDSTQEDSTPIDVPQMPDHYQVIVWPDDRLNIPGEPVEDINNEITEIVLKMFATLTIHQGIGLAAPQVGLSLNIITFRLDPKQPMVLINPEYVEICDDEMYSWEEGCLSVPGYFKTNKRPSQVAIRFQDETGKEREVEFNGLGAFAIQHEMDHLEGKVFVDGVSSLKQMYIEKKIKKTLRNRKC